MTLTRHEYHEARRLVHGNGLTHAAKWRPKAADTLEALAAQPYDPLAWRVKLAATTIEPLAHRLQMTAPLDVYYRWRERCQVRRAQRPQFRRSAP